MSRFVKIGEAARLLGITIQTLRRWELEGSFLPDRKSKGGTRYYALDRIIGVKPSENDLTIAYARVSSHDQKKDLETQAQLLTQYCAAKGW